MIQIILYKDTPDTATNILRYHNITSNEGTDFWSWLQNELKGRHKKCRSMVCLTNMFSLLGHENDILTVLDACGTIVIVEKDHSIYFRGSMLSQKLHTFSD